MKLTHHPGYVRHRFPAEVISYAVWLYFCFPLSLRMIEEMLAARGILVSYETVRQSALKFGQTFASQVRRRLPAAGDKWHLHEVVITITGERHWLWRAVDQNGVVLDILVRSRRDTKATKRLLRKLLKKQGIAPRVMITDKLASYAAAKKAVMPGVEHRQHKGLNNRAENSHEPPNDASTSSQPVRPDASSPFTIKLGTSSAVPPTPTLLITASPAPEPSGSEPR